MNSNTASGNSLMLFGVFGKKYLITNGWPNQLHWRHMNIIESQISASWPFFQRHAQAKKRENTSSSATLVLYEGNPSVTDGFPSQRASNAESVSMPCHHRVFHIFRCTNLNLNMNHLDSLKVSWHWWHISQLCHQLSSVYKVMISIFRTVAKYLTTGRYFF